MKKLFSILFILLLVVCVASCELPNNKPNDQTYEVKFLDEKGNVLGIEKVEKNKTINEPSYSIDGYDTISWLYNGKPWDFENDIVQSNIELVIKTKAHVHEFVNGTCKCGYKLSDSSLPTLSEEELKNLTATVTFWHTMGQSNQVVIDEIIKAFNEIYPNIKVTHSSQGDYADLRHKILISMLSGQTPTIALASPDDISLYLGQSVGNVYYGPMALDEFINHPVYGLTNKQLEDFDLNSLKQSTSFDDNGKFYSVPFIRNTEVLYFNATWFEEKGLLEKYNLGEIEYVDDIPTFVRNEGAVLTWEQIEEIGKFFVEQHEYKALSTAEKSDYYFMSYDDEANLFITLTKQWGGEYTKLTGANQGEFVFNNAQSKATVQWYKDAFDAGYFATASAWGDPDAYTSDRFVNGQVKMVIGSSAGANYNNPGDKFVLGILPYPQRENSEHKYAFLNSIDLTLFDSKSELEELAGWLFIKYLTTWTEGLPVEKQPAYIWNTRTGYFPVLNSVRNSLEYNKFLQEGSLNGIAQKIALEQREYFYSAPSFIGSAYCRDEVENLIEAVLYANYNVEDAFNNALDQLL